ncbi:metallophosphoesterase [Vibrio methylphosphonaticus]|uniref:metallophosphoesterase n=1 Tax=Vibrio methylphosphonaticus TaxID=2946866 RepID=UPI00202A12F0|nr:metallophosphoesterase [Vibrio methylphosphonaticus]MCL9773967.1 metallophosphoesterase [Vibrio methylphosphonaticus]
MNVTPHSLSILVACTLPLILTACNSDDTVSLGDRIPPAPVKVFGPECNTASTSQTVRFIHVADLHGHFGFQEKYYSKIKAVHNQALSEQPYTLFTNGGDDYEKGSVAEQLSRGDATLEATQALAFDYRVIGNHDFAWGPEQLLKYSRDDVATVLASNTEYDGNDPQGFDGVNFAIAQVGCVKIGFFGMTSGPWNELDQEVKPQTDFIPDFSMRWDWNDRARQLISDYAQDVDYMIMLSHLGFGTDKALATYVDGIDLILGGHSHATPEAELINNTMVVLPDFNAKGYTDIEITFNLSDKSAVITQPIVSTDIELTSSVDQTTQNKIDTILGRYAPDAHTEIAVSKSQPTRTQMRDILYNAMRSFTNPETQEYFEIDASILNENEIEDSEIWAPGSLTQEHFHRSYPIERQPANTPGFTALYQVQVLGSELKLMVDASSQLQYNGPNIDEVDDQTRYNVALFKSAAWNPELFFNANYYEKEDAVLIAEAWQLYDVYARNRTANCQFIDSDDVLYSCDDDAINATTIWNFNDPDNIFNGEQSQRSSLSLQTNTGELADCNSAILTCGTTDALGIPDLPDGSTGNVIKLEALIADEIGELALQTTHAANGDFASQDLISNYTLAFDVLWPESSSNEYRAILDANDLNNKVEIYLNESNQLGLYSQYAGTFMPNTWYRIALVFYTSETGDVVYKLYADGKFISTMRYSAGEGFKWAMNKSTMRLFTDTEYQKYEAEPVYLNALLFTPRPLTDVEVASLGTAKSSLTFTPTVRELNQTVERFYENAPEDWAHKWIKQRAKFMRSTSSPSQTQDSQTIRLK